ncbi:MAG: hypothetical protein IPK82_13765 [Polyangiaceae bacterium]|nr:hypothetical protein [Polyangiaceae bacterium]
MQRDESANAEAMIETVESAESEEAERPSISLEELALGTRVHPAAPAAEHAATLQVAPGLRTARVTAVSGREALVVFRGGRTEIKAALSPEMDADLVEYALAEKESVLVEVGEAGEVFVVGLVQTKKPSEVHVTGEKVVVEGGREVLIRSGRAALRLREDGDVELVGSRISAASRGLFRIVGRILRLN